jgi:hypothetical protein
MLDNGCSSEQVNQMIKNNGDGIDANRHQFRIHETEFSKIAIHTMEIEHCLTEILQDEKQPSK